MPMLHNPYKVAVVHVFVVRPGMIDMVRQRLQRLPEGVTAEDEATLAEMRDIFSGVPAHY